MNVNPDITVHVPYTGDWCVVMVGDKEIYSGHDSYNKLAQSLLSHLDCNVRVFEYPDDEYAEEFS